MEPTPADPSGSAGVDAFQGLASGRIVVMLSVAMAAGKPIETREGTHRSPGRNAVVPLLLGGLVLAALLLLPWRPWLQEALRQIGALGAWGPVLFVALYVLATVFLVPGSVLTLGAGAAFGVAWGSVYVSVASTAGAAAAFLVGRHLARDFVARRLASKPVFLAIDEAVGEGGWRIVLLTRLSPVLPFTLLNYAYGLTRVRFVDYLMASWIGMMPGTVLYVYLGSVARTAADGARRSPWEWVVQGAGLLATLAVTLLVTRVARRSWRRRLDPLPGNGGRE